MGYGDWLMAAGEAKAAHAATGRPVLVTDAAGKPQWSEVFDHNPYILRAPGDQPFTRVISASGVRPYIASKSAGRWTWKPYKPIPAEMFFTDEELSFAEPYRGSVLIEPKVKATGHGNKAWPWHCWVQFAAWAPNYMPGIRLIQCAPNDGGKKLPDMSLVVTPSFRHALALLSVCRALVTTEGGLMHGAAAVGVPAVVLWSEFIDPSITGYAQHTNLRHAHRTCGMRINCPSCRKSMEAITVREVTDALMRILK